jgi:cytochrome oxidase Cu insertion factor (SCO1/SenC/PrrC family)
MNELMTGTGPIGGPFLLTDQQGRRAGPAQWRGKVVLMYFGYTFCPDACPTDLSSIAAAIEALGPDGIKVQPVFVTLDPLRDTPRMLGDYVKSFNPRFVALGGTEEEVRRVALRLECRGAIRGLLSSRDKWKAHVRTGQSAAAREFALARHRALDSAFRSSTCERRLGTHVESIRDVPFLA